MSFLATRLNLLALCLTGILLLACSEALLAQQRTSNLPQREHFKLAAPLAEAVVGATDAAELEARGLVRAADGAFQVRLYMDPQGRSEVQNALTSAGWSFEVAGPAILDAKVPLSGLPALEAQPAIRFVRPAYKGVPGTASKAALAVITVNETTCTLVDAITAANTDAPVGGSSCTAGMAGLDEIVLTVDVTLTAVNNTTYGPNGTPVVTSPITITGDGFTVSRDGAAPAFRIFDVDLDGDLTLNNVTVSNGLLGSSADPLETFGAGILSQGGLTLNQATVDGNDASDGAGGGVFIGPGSAGDINFSTISNNNAFLQGGGINNEDGTLMITQSTISGNTVSEFAGGGIETLAFDLALTTLYFTTVTNNSAPVGGGLANTDVLSEATSVQTSLENSLVATQAGGADCENEFGTAAELIDSTPGYTLDSDGSCIAGGGTGNVTADPLLGPLMNNGGPTQTHALPEDEGNPAVDEIPTGTNGCTAGGVDQRGEPRANGSGNGGDSCDYGAFEAPLQGLPVELISFDVQVEKDAAVLSWETATETNNAGFEVQSRRGGDEAFNTQGFVEGAGTTLEPRTYSYRARDLGPGAYTFRLKQVDYDGSFAYSPEVEVTLDLVGAFVLEPAYPNPFNPETTLRFAVRETQTVRVVLYDALGRPVRLLYEGVPSGERTAVRIDGQGLPSGMYLVQLTGDGIRASRQVTLLK